MDSQDFDGKTRILAGLIEQGTFDEFTQGYQALLDELAWEQKMVTNQAELVTVKAKLVRMKALIVAQLIASRLLLEDHPSWMQAVEGPGHVQ